MASTVIVTNIPVPNSNSLIHNTVNAKKRSCAAEGGRNFLYIHASASVSRNPKAPMPRTPHIVLPSTAPAPAYEKELNLHSWFVSRFKYKATREIYYIFLPPLNTACPVIPPTVFISTAVPQHTSA